MKFGSFVLTVSLLTFFLGLATLTAFLCAPGPLGLALLALLAGMLLWSVALRARAR